MAVIFERNRKRRRQVGVAYLEMVFVLPLFLFLLFGIVEFSMMFGRWQTLSNAAREGARAAVVFRTGCDQTQVESEVDAVVQSYAASSGISLAPADVTVTGACSPAGERTTVTVQYQHTFRVLSGFSDGMGPTVDLVGTSSMRNEGNG